MGASSAPCPHGGQLASHCHSTYAQQVHDLLGSDQAVGYAKEAHEGARHVEHIADRWPRLKNLKESSKRRCRRVSVYGLIGIAPPYF